MDDDHDEEDDLYDQDDDDDDQRGTSGTHDQPARRQLRSGVRGKMLLVSLGLFLLLIFKTNIYFTILVLFSSQGEDITCEFWFIYKNSFIIFSYLVGC